uniref:Uncharacterized protein n=1 Tax=Malus domestica TaxID=3750 RepID=A7M6H5_MALDO|nr:hypothetical protein [Malus domestica]
MGGPWWWCFLRKGPYQGRQEWRLHCEAGCQEHCSKWAGSQGHRAGVLCHWCARALVGFR